MIQSPQDEVFYNLFREECDSRGLSWYYTDHNRYRQVSFGAKDMANNTFFDKCINVIGRDWQTLYTGLMKWIIEQDVTKITPYIITASIWQYGIDNNIEQLSTKEYCEKVTDFIYKWEDRE